MVESLKKSPGKNKSAANGMVNVGGLGPGGCGNASKNTAFLRQISGGRIGHGQQISLDLCCFVVSYSKGTYP